MISTSIITSPLSKVLSGGCNILAIINLIAWWKIFKKMGYQGWESLIPFYSTYLLFKELYGNGFSFLKIFIPIYNIYVAIKYQSDFAHSFNKGTGFVWGLVLLNSTFIPILELGDLIYLDGSKENTKPTFSI